jgi:hypothetical protein
MDYRDIDLQTSFEIQVIDKTLFTEEDDELQPLKMNFMDEERKHQEGGESDPRHLLQALRETG